jgi:signal transduction histidine kinase
MKSILRAIFQNKPLSIVLVGFLMTIGTFIGNIILTRDITYNLRQNVGKVEAIYSELGLILQIENDLTFAENTLKNFLLSRQSIYLRGHERAIGRLTKAMSELEVRTKESQFFSSQLPSLSRLLDERKTIFLQSRNVIEKNPDENSQQTSVLLSAGADKTLEIRETLHKLEGELRVTLEINRKYIDRSISYGSYTNYLAIGIALVVAFFSTYSITQDFIRQKEIERILRQLNDDKTRLFSILGHDLRSPLSGINAIIYILKNHRSSLSEADVADYILQLEQSSLNYGKLLEDVLTWSRLQLNKIQIQPEPHSIKVLVQDVADLYQEQIHAKKLTLHNLVPSDLVLTVDKSMILTVLRNLVSNSIKFSHAGSEIKVSYKEEKDSFLIEVQDQGVGMAQAVVKTLFTNSTISMTGTENEAGTGLGLSICKEFLSKQDGDLRVVSEEGKGSTFTIVLPKPQSTRKRAAFPKA